MALLGKLMVSLGLDTSEYDDGTASAKGKLESFGGEMTKVGGVLTAGISLPLIGIGAAALDASTKLNEGMANVQSLGLTQQRVEALKTGVQDLAIEVGKGTADMTDGLYQVESAFGDNADTMKDLEINAKAAAAGQATVRDAIDLTSAVTKGYGDTSAAALTHVSDLALKTVQLGKTDFPELARSIGGVVPLANQLKVSQEELFATMATATGVTGGASEVATQMRGTLQSLMAPTKDMTDLMTRLGYSNGEAMIKSLGYQGTLEAIVKAANETHTPLQKYLSSIEGQTLALTLAGAQSSTYQDKLAQLKNAAGATEQAFDAQTQGVNKAGFAMAQAKEKMEVMLQRLGDGLGPALLAASNAVAPLVDKALALATQFANLDPKTQTMIVTVAALAAGIPIATVAIGALVTALATLMSPITLVIAVVALLAVAWMRDWGGIQEKTAAVWALLEPIFSAIGTYIGTRLPGVLSAMGTAFTTAWSLATKGAGLVSDALSTLSGWVTKVSSGDVSLNFTPPDWITKLVAWVWPTPATVEWIVKLLSWAWPLLGPVAWVVALMAWIWPKVQDQPSWIERLIKWVWPNFEMPAWLERLFNWSWPSLPSLPSWLGGGGGSTGSSTDPNTVTGSSVGYARHLSGMTASTAGGGVTVNFSGPITINNDMDIEEIAWRVAKLIGRK